MWKIIRPFLFLLPPEWAHFLGGLGLKFLGFFPLARPEPHKRAWSFCGYPLSSPLGLAAGFDKNGDYVKGLRRIGFGFVEVGTVTLKPQPGNPPPRLFRLPDAEALINRMGFNSEGAEVVSKRLKLVRAEQLGFPLGVNLGKNKETPLDLAGQEYAQLVNIFYDLADYLVINISSPNTPALTDLQEGDLLLPLLKQVSAARDRQVKGGSAAKPLLLKISPDLLPDSRRKAIEMAMENGFQGIIASNTSRRRNFPELAGVSTALLEEAGGVSGPPLQREQREIIPEIRKLIGPKAILISAGGLADGVDARERMALGANFVQVYTRFIYAGPSFPRKLLRDF